jgi:TrmH family RNA methyltransferase
MISSSQNPKVRLVRALMGRPKERREAGAFLAEGVRLVEAALEAGWPVRFVLFSRGLSERGLAVVRSCGMKKIEVEELPVTLVRSLSGTENTQGILAVLEETPLPIPESPNFLLIPDRIRDPGNLGMLLRSALACGVQAVLVPPETVDPFAPKVLRSGMGAHFRLPIQRMRWDEIQRRTASMQALVADMGGRSCWEMDLRQPLALVIGSEAQGASAPAFGLAAERIGVPMTGGVDSLNAGAAGSVLMFEVMRQRSRK